DDDVLGGDIQADLSVRVDGVVHRVIARMNRELLRTEGRCEGKVQYDVFINGKHVGLVGRFGQEVHLQVPIVPGDAARDGPGLRRKLKFNLNFFHAADTKTSAVKTPATDSKGTSDDDVLGGDIRADLSVRIDGVIHQVIARMNRDLL